jgi:hypothetical protein
MNQTVPNHDLTFSREELLQRAGRGGRVVSCSTIGVGTSTAAMWRNIEEFRGVWFGVLKHCSIFVLFDKKFLILD